MNRVLIVRIGALGDAVHTLPLVNEIKRLSPETEIHWAAGAGIRKFLKGHPAIDEFVAVDRGVGGLVSAVRSVRKRFDLAIDTQGLMKSSVIARSASRRVIGRGHGHAREMLAPLLYSDRVAPVGAHIIDQNLSLLRILFPGEQLRATYNLAPISFPEWDLLEERPILFNIGGGWRTKLWPLRSFVELGKRIQSELGLPLGIVWGPGEEKDARLIARETGAELAPPTTFDELGSLFRHAKLVVSGETGPLHLAVAVDCPVVALIGPTSNGRNGPHPSSRHVSVITDVKCSPCYSRACADFRCMPGLPVRSVFEGICKLI